MVLITGASGFIGKHLLARLSKTQQVTVLPRELLYNFVNLKKFLKEVNPDYIYHLAAYGNKYDQTDEKKIFKANIEGTWNLLWASKAIKYKAFINTGTSSEYGTKQHIMQENDSLDTDTFYGVTKASATLLCRAFAKKFNKPVVTIRPFSVYGDNDDPKHFIPTVIKCFKTGQELILSKGVHDWINIEDLIEGIIFVTKNIDKLKGQAINIGTGYQTSNYEIVSIIRGILGIPGKIKHVDRLRTYDTTISWVADNSLLCSLGWEPKHHLDKDLERMIYE